MKLIPFLLVSASFFILKQTKLFAEPEFATIKVNGVEYHVVLNKDESVSISTTNGKVINHLKKDELYLDYEMFDKFEFVDFNGDGNKDIFIKYQSNVAGRCDLLLYDKTSKNFIKVKNFPDYPVPIHIKHTQLFYSYHRSGCADEAWDSDLFKIVNYKVVTIGNISGQGCNTPPEKNIILINKIKGNVHRVIKKYPIDEPAHYKNTKWGFIADYWIHNYVKFL